MPSADQLVAAYAALSPFEKAYVDRRCAAPCGPAELEALYAGLSPSERRVIDARIQGTSDVADRAGGGIPDYVRQYWWIPVVGVAIWTLTR